MSWASSTSTAGRAAHCPSSSCGQAARSAARLRVRAAAAAAHEAALVVRRPRRCPWDHGSTPRQLHPQLRPRPAARLAVASEALGSTATAPDHQHASSSSSAPLDPDQALMQRITGILVERDTPAGRVSIRAVSEPDVMGACVVLTRAFAGTPEEINLADARRYVDSVVSNPPRGVLFVARIVPTDPSLLPPNQTSRLIGTVALSLHEDTMQQIPTLPPPSDTAYLSNMAVDSKFRRLGVARALMSACGEAARAAGLSDIYLHVRQGDEPAEKLYATEGFVEVARDSFLAAKLKNVRPRILMKAAVQ